MTRKLWIHPQILATQDKHDVRFLFTFCDDCGAFWRLERQRPIGGSVAVPSKCRSPVFPPTDRPRESKRHSCIDERCSASSCIRTREQQHREAVDQIDQNPDPAALDCVSDGCDLDEMSESEHAHRCHGAPVGGKTEGASQSGWYDEQEATPADSGCDERRQPRSQGFGLERSRNRGATTMSLGSLTADSPLFPLGRSVEA